MKNAMMKWGLLFALLMASLQTVAVGQSGSASRGVVCSAEFHASDVGAEILNKGGNAVDAAVATALALAVTYPAAGNIGGGGFMVIRLADGRSTAIDYREMAPLRSSRNMYLDAAGNLIPDSSIHGIRSAGVPGTIAGLALAQKKYGTMKWSDVVEPARKLAADGFVISRHLAQSLKGDKWLTKDPESYRLFQRSGDFYREGELLKQPDLANVLARIQKSGPDEFYSGETAKIIVQFMEANGGLITAADLKGYKAVERKPVTGKYRGYEILTMPPPSSGGIVLMQMLTMLEKYDSEKLTFGTETRPHILAEVMRRCFADRSEYFGDPDFVKVPASELLDRKYLESRSKAIDLDHATPSAEIKAGLPASYESNETTHFSVMDSHGNCVSNTYTLNFGFGSGVTVKGAGFILNDEMDDFAAKPGSPNGFGLIQGEKNAIAARKRPLSSMTPTIVSKNGRPVLVVGSPGGPTIINSVLQTIINVVDLKLPLEKAVASNRIHHQWLPDEIAMERRNSAPNVVTRLQQMGHKVKLQGTIGDVQAIFKDPVNGSVTGVSDPRSADGKASYQK